MLKIIAGVFVFDSKVINAVGQRSEKEKASLEARICDSLRASLGVTLGTSLGASLKASQKASLRSSLQL